MERRQKLLTLAISLAILGTASLYILSAGMEHREVLGVRDVLKNPDKYLYKEIEVEGNASDVRHYGNTTVFFLKDGGYSLRCVYFGNLSVEEKYVRVLGSLRYNEKWGVYEFVVEKIL